MLICLGLVSFASVGEGYASGGDFAIVHGMSQSPKEFALGGDFVLTSHRNKPYALHEASGKVVVLFFGFTHCPDVCPTTLSVIQTVLEQLGNDAKHVQPLFVSVDPQRDTPAVLQNYLKYFSSSFIGLTGPIEEIDDVVKQFKGFYSYTGDASTGTYSVDHTSNIYLIDPKGVVTTIIPYGIPPNAITSIIEKILAD